MKKAHELAQLCQADLALIIYKNNRFYMYRSLERGSWPPSRADIVSSTAANLRLTHGCEGKVLPAANSLAPKGLQGSVY